MPRSVEASEGLALLGAGRIGEIAFRVPGLLSASPPAGPRSDGAIEGVQAEPGQRRLRVTTPQGQLEIGFHVPAPEVSGIPGGWEGAAPSVAFVHWPLNDAERTQLHDAAPGLVILGNARTLLSEGRPFVEALRELRVTVGAGAILWAPRVALPARLALLTYLGVDLMDTTEALLAPGAGRLDATLGSLDEAALQLEGLSTGAGDRAHEVQAAFEGELALVRAALRAGRLRELVELRTCAEPLLAELLRYADQELGRLLEERTPVTAERSHSYVPAESLRRPEAVRFRSRFLERYRPPPSKEVLLLVPCSRTKPYRNSRSHRRFADALEGTQHLARVHTVSLTSPLGAVPRELEDVPPAAHYDIPVTGEWSETERTMVTDAVGHLLAHGRYRSVIAHLDPEEYRFLRPLLEAGPRCRWSMTDHRSTAPEALAALRNAADRETAELTPVAGGPLAAVREELQELASFQFGRRGAELLFAPPVRLHGRPWAQRLTDGSGVDLATWQEGRGLFHLTAAGGQRMLPSGALRVEVADGVELRGDLFTPGVRSADLGVREGDAVLLVRGGDLLGVGEARLPGRLMQELPRGLAVAVRHRLHRPPAAPPTGT